MTPSSIFDLASNLLMVFVSDIQKPSTALQLESIDSSFQFC